MPASETIVSAPFILGGQTVGAIMRQVIYALIPCIIVSIYFFGWGVITNILISSASSLLFELLMLLLRKRPLSLYLRDGSALLTAILLALALPPLSPWWLIVIGCFFAIVVAKQLYGGLGYNPLNPAMAGYAVLMISFPMQMSFWVAPIEFPHFILSMTDTWNLLFAHKSEVHASIDLDALTAATPLDVMRSNKLQGISLSEMHNKTVTALFFDNGMAWINIACLVGGLWLRYKKLITWAIPLSVLCSLFFLSLIFHNYNQDAHASPLVHMLSGATMMCAFFIATDPVSAAGTPLGKIFYGCGIGILIFIIREWGTYPDAVAFAVLFMNLCAPMIDQYTVPKAFGDRGKHAHHR